MTLTRIPRIVAATLAVVTLGLGGLALAQGGHRRGPGGPGEFGPGFGGRAGGAFPMLRQLDLSDAQREQIRGILDQNQEESKAIRERLAAARKTQRAAIETLPTDEAQIRARTSDLSAIEADAAVQRAKVHAAVFQVLTPEQQEKAKQLQVERQQRGAEVRQRMQERRQQRQQQRQQAAPPAGEI